MSVALQSKEKFVFIIIVALSSVVFLFVLILDSKLLPRPQPMPAFVKYLPLLNAIINGTCAVLLLLSLKASLAKNVQRHKKINILTFVLSTIFLLIYVTYH